MNKIHAYNTVKRKSAMIRIPSGRQVNEKESESKSRDSGRIAIMLVQEQ